jgi:glycosyltransferase involved in cell wall biosynthesis
MPPDAAAPAATIVIATKDRKEDLAAALESCFAQSAPVEVIVMDDGSSDGTGQLVRDRFPRASYHRVERSQGYIRQRNRGAELARAPYVFSIDDDAVFSTPRVVAQTLAEFDRPRVGAVAIPFVNVRQDDLVRQRAPDDGRVWVTSSYVGTAHALRRDLFLRSGGYRAHLVHQGEEMDFCVRMYDAGHVVRLGRADPIHHFESPRRDFRRIDLHGRRNDVLYAWHNVPARSLPVHLLGTTLNGLRFGLKCGRFGRHALGLLVGYRAIFEFWNERKPVDGATYRLSRLLKARGRAPLDEIEPLLPPMRGGNQA